MEQSNGPIEKEIDTKSNVTSTDEAIDKDVKGTNTLRNVKTVNKYHGFVEHCPLLGGGGLLPQ